MDSPKEGRVRGHGIYRGERVNFIRISFNYNRNRSTSTGNHKKGDEIITSITRQTTNIICHCEGLFYPQHSEELCPRGSRCNQDPKVYDRNLLEC